jgi:hypothetical protein
LSFLRRQTPEDRLRLRRALEPDAAGEPRGRQATGKQADYVGRSEQKHSGLPAKPAYLPIPSARLPQACLHTKWACFL